MRQNVAAVWALILLVGSLSDPILAKRNSSPSLYKNRSRPKPGYQPKKGLSNKAKIAAGVAAGAVGGLVIGSALSQGGPSGRMRGCKATDDCQPKTNVGYSYWGHFNQKGKEESLWVVRKDDIILNIRVVE